jgi:hypothetical protein
MTERAASLRLIGGSPEFQLNSGDPESRLVSDITFLTLELLGATHRRYRSLLHSLSGTLSLP